MSFQEFPVIRTAQSVTVFFDGRQRSVNRNTPQAQLVEQAIAAGNLIQLRAAFDIRAVATQRIVASFGGQSGRVRVDGERVFVTDTEGYESEVSGIVVTRLFEAIKQGYGFEPIFRFIENVNENPSRRARHELYGFMEACNLPITPDGHFLANKKVRRDYTDVHSGTMDNRVGKVLTMPRHEVDDDKNRTCSTGLHFCSKSYLSHFGGERIMILKINPRDVVAIPADYRNAKGRTCRYEVVGELDLATNKSVESAGSDFVDDGSGEDALGVTVSDTMTPEAIQEERDTKLVYATEQAIRSAYFEGGESLGALANRYGVSFSTISAVLDADIRSGQGRKVNAPVAPIAPATDKVATKPKAAAKPAASNVGQSALSDDTVRAIRKELKAKVPVAEVARNHNTSARTVARIRDKETYTHVK